LISFSARFTLRAVAFHKNPVMGCVLLSIGIVFAKIFPRG
jgi:hypothetical protein